MACQSDSECPANTACQNGFCEGDSACQPTVEVCDGLDNDGDGQIDNDVPGTGSACGISNIGSCHFGILHCTAGTLVCSGSVGPSVEICDGIDNDCDGIVDDNATCPSGTTCQNGACSP